MLQKFNVLFSRDILNGLLISLIVLKLLVVALIDELLSQAAETAWLEFKGNNSDPEGIGRRCSALSNAARIEGQDFAYMVWGVEDGSRAVIGTSFS